MRAVSLFSGIGGFDLGLERAGIEIILQVEIDEFCRRVLAKHWPDVRRISDVRDVTAEDCDGADLIFGGFPCQPFSQSGKRLGIADERWMWPEFARIVRGARPRYVLLENVAALVRDDAAFGCILSDLHELGFDAEWTTLSACAMGAPHMRRRLFLLAYHEGADVSREVSRRSWPDEAGSDESRGGGGGTWADWWLSEPDVDRVAHGLPRWVVRPPLEALGNAVVPQVAELIGHRLVEVDRWGRRGGGLE